MKGKKTIQELDTGEMQIKRIKRRIMMQRIIHQHRESWRVVSAVGRKNRR